MPTKEELIEILTELGASKDETKSQRLQLLVTPSMHEALKKLSKGTGLSVNAIVNEALDEYLKGKNDAEDN